MFAPMPGARAPPSSQTLVPAELFLLYVLTLLSTPAHKLFPLLKYTITEALPLLHMGSALAGGRSVLEPAGISSIDP